MPDIRKTYLFRGRLAQFSRSATHAEAWDERWAAIDLQQQYRWADKGALGVYRDSFLRCLPHQGLIVEAGCGTGRYVRALQALGYQTIGLDFALTTLRHAKGIWPEAPLACADVSRFPFPDGLAAAVISLGVIEHFLDPWDFLQDTVRILRRSGLLYLVVPYANPVRYRRMRRGAYPERQDEHDFYQYLLDSAEVEASLRRLGLCPIESFPTSGYSGLVDEWPGMDAWVRRLPTANRLINGLNRSRPLAHWLGHVMHYIAVKE